MSVIREDEFQNCLERIIQLVKLVGCSKVSLVCRMLFLAVL
jgi:hypothetical protein